MIKLFVQKLAISLEIRPLSGIGMLMPTTFASLSFVSVLKKYMGLGYNAARGLVSRDIA